MLREWLRCLHNISLTIRNFFRVLIVAVGLAAIIGCLTGFFLRVLYWLTTLFWETIPEAITVLPDHPLYTIIVCTIGGAILGAGRNYLGDYPRDVNELISLIESGHSIRHSVISKGALNSLISLTFGASLGPELALATIAGGLSSQVIGRLTTVVNSTWAATAMGASPSLQYIISRSDHMPERFNGSGVPPVPRWWKGVPIFTALVCGLVALKIAAGSGLQFGYSVPSFQSTIVWRLAVAVLIGGIGGFLSVFYLKFRYRLRYAGTTQNALVQSTFGGCLLGLAGAIAPRILFSGQDVIGELFTGLPLAAGVLLVAGFAKITMVGVMLEAGWKGGPILPLMAGGATLGAGLAEVIPEIGPVVGITAMMASLPVSELTRPLIIATSIALFFSPSLFLVATVGAIAGAVVIRLTETLQRSKNTALL